MFFQKPVDLVRRNHDRADRDIMIQGIDDESHEFAHISGHKVRLFLRAGRKVSEIGDDHAVDVALFIILIELIKAVGEKAEGRADKHPSCSPLLDLLCHVKHALAG